MVCGLCQLLLMQWDGLWSVSLTLAAMGWSVFCVTYSRCCEMVCVLCHLLRSCEIVCVLCHLLSLQWDGLCSVSLTPEAMGWSVVCVTYSGCNGMVCGLCHLLLMQWDGLWSVSLTLAAVGWSVFCVTYS